MAKSAACGIEQTVELTKGIDLSTFVRGYLSREYRDDRAAGCTMAALGSDAARQTQEFKRAFAAGIESLLQAFEQECSTSDRAGHDEARAKSIATFAYIVGALVMSRACPDDSPLAEEILAVCRDKILGALAEQEGAPPPAAAHAIQSDVA
ncbi:TetR/AcrR family transcriptional regulator [Comamonas testosteroni]|uniref:LmrA/YxaF family transcription factor n=1 Tax=Comamonas testosteroni TaxID=285 RepID=UPI003899EA46